MEHAPQSAATSPRSPTEPCVSSADALRFGWTKTRENLRPMLALGVLTLLLSVAHQALMAPSGSDGPLPMLAGCVQLAQILLTSIYLRFALKLVDGEPLVLERGSHLLLDFLGFLLTSVLYGLLVSFGLLLLVFPGVIWATKFSFAVMLVLDRQIDPFSAFKESARLTEGFKLRLLGFMLVLGCVNILGAIALGVGLIMTIPTTFIAAAYALRQLQARAGVAPSGSPKAPMQTASV